MLNSTHSSSRSAKKTRNEKKTPSARLTEAPVQSQDAKSFWVDGRASKMRRRTRLPAHPVAYKPSPLVASWRLGDLSDRAATSR